MSVLRNIRRLVENRQKKLVSIEVERRQHSDQLTEVIHSSWSYIKSHESQFYCELTRLITQHHSVVTDFLFTAKLIRALQVSLQQLDVTSPAEQQAVLGEVLQQLSSMTFDSSQCNRLIEDFSQTVNTSEQDVVGPYVKHHYNLHYRINIFLPFRTIFYISYSQFLHQHLTSLTFHVKLKTRPIV